MPETVTDRPTKSHSYIFLLAKQPRYFFDQEAVRETSRYNWDTGTLQERCIRRHRGSGYTEVASQANGPMRYRPMGKRGPQRPVGWTHRHPAVPGAHFAIFPEAFARRCILAGTSEHGCCPECGAPWQREAETGLDKTHQQRRRRSTDKDARQEGNATIHGWHQRAHVALEHEYETVGWRPGCLTLDTEADPSWCRSDGHYRRRPVPCVVLDPFVGAAPSPMSPGCTDATQSAST